MRVHISVSLYTYIYIYVHVYMGPVSVPDWWPCPAYSVVWPRSSGLNFGMMQALRTGNPQLGPRQLRNARVLRYFCRACYSDCLNGGFKVNSGTVEWYGSSYGTHLENSEILSSTCGWVLHHGLGRGDRPGALLYLEVQGSYNWLHKCNHKPTCKAPK